MRDSLGRACSTDNKRMDPGSRRLRGVCVCVLCLLVQPWQSRHRNDACGRWGECLLASCV